MTPIESKLAEHQQRQYLNEHYSQFVNAAGYSDADFDTLTAEDALILAGIICSRIRPRLFASGPLKSSYGAKHFLDYLDAMSDDDKAELRAGINFKQPLYVPTKSWKK